MTCHLFMPTGIITTRVYANMRLSTRATGERHMHTKLGSMHALVTLIIAVFPQNPGGVH